MADNTTLPGTGDVIAADDVGGVKHQQVKVEFGPLDTATLVTSTVGLPSNQIQVGNTNVNAFPAGFQRTSDEPRQMFYDPFDAALDTTNRWASPTSAGGGVAASVTAGSLTLGSGTTNNGYSYLTSQSSFVPSIPAWISNSWAISIEFAVGNNAVRFWGCGIVGGTPSSTSPLGATGNGYGFELDTAGVLQAVVYANGTRTVVSSLAALQPADNALHRYICFYRTDRTYWYIDGLGSAQLAATSSFQSPQVQTLPLLMLAVAHSTGPAASRVITCTGLAMADTGKNTTNIGDGVYPWRKQTVLKASTAAVATDFPAVVALHPSSTGPVNNAQINGVTPLMGNGVTGTGSQRVTIASDNTAFSTNATLVDVLASGTITTQNLVPAGTATAGSAVEITLSNGYNTLGIQVTGTYTGGLSPQGTIDGTNWVTIGGTPLMRATTQALGATIVSAAQDVYHMETGAYKKVRITGLAAITGTATVTLIGATSAALVSIDNTPSVNVSLLSTISAGSNVIGDVGLAARGTSNAFVVTRFTAAATTNGTVLRAAPGRLYKVLLFNNTASAKFLKFSNSTSITVGTTAVVLTMIIPASGSLNVDFLIGQYFSTGISLGVTGAIGDTDTTATAVNDVVGEFLVV